MAAGRTEQGPLVPSFFLEKLLAETQTDTELCSFGRGGHSSLSHTQPVTPPNWTLSLACPSHSQGLALLSSIPQEDWSAAQSWDLQSASPGEALGDSGGHWLVQGRRHPCPTCEHSWHHFPKRFTCPGLLTPRGPTLLTLLLQKGQLAEPKLKP